MGSTAFFICRLQVAGFRWQASGGRLQVAGFNREFTIYVTSSAFPIAVYRDVVEKILFRILNIPLYSLDQFVKHLSNQINSLAQIIEDHFILK